MATLLTGGAGYIGSHAALALLGSGSDVVVIDDLSTGFRWAVPQQVPFYHGDIADRALVRRIFNEHPINSAIHFAASTVVPESIEDPLKYYANNVCAALCFLNICIEKQVRYFVFSSSAAVYGNTEQEPISEEMPLVPVSPYGRSKAQFEQILADAAAAHSFRYAILRYFNVAGADELLRTGQSTINATHLIKVVCEAAAGKRPFVPIFGSGFPTPDGTGVRDYIHVSDLANCHLSALEYVEAGGESILLNCGYGHGYSVLEIVAATEAEIGRKIPTKMLDARTGDCACVVADTERLRTRLKWQPRFDDLRKIIRDALAWENALPLDRMSFPVSQ